MTPSALVRSALAVAWLGNAVVVTAQSVRGTAVPSVAFVNVTVVPMDLERVLPHHTVSIEDGVITHVGPVADELDTLIDSACQAIKGREQPSSRS